VRSGDRIKAALRIGDGGRASEKPPPECSEHDLIARFKSRHAALPLYAKLMRRLRARRKKLQSHDADIYPLW
jgi:hypothetical protein